MGFRNVSAWRNAINQVGQDINKITRDATPAIARYARDTIRKRIPPGASSTSGMSNPFPGYAATGRMQNMVVAGPVRGSGNAYAASVGVALASGVLDLQKFYVHEYGMVIRAKNGPYLVFQVQGKWVKVPQVRIKAKRFFRSGWAEAQQNFPDVLGQFVLPRWPGKR